MYVESTNPSSQSPMDIIEEHVFFKPPGTEGWLSKPELPTADEILRPQSEIEQLPLNPVDVPWASKARYLEAQYGILRCEAVEGLRYSVRSFVDHRGQEPMCDDDFTNIYTKVRVTRYVMSTVGPLATISFSTERAKFNIRWQQSKRLQPGKIVALSPAKDNFRTICKIATVAQRPFVDGLDQDPPLVDILWANPEDAVLDPNLDLVMIESLHGYFESARHALVGLQQVAQNDSPLDQYLTGMNVKDNCPKFIEEDPIMDLSTLVHHNTGDKSQDVWDFLRTHDVVKDGIPALEDLTLLDESQLLAHQWIVSKELAVIQGPPGTGKTYTSVEAIKTMVINRRRRRGPPIIVAAQTNHALDQLLAHCIGFGASCLRMGGRTQHDEIRPRTLFELRRAAQVPADRKCGSVDHRRRENVGKIQRLVDALFSSQLLDPDALLEFGIITKAQHESLCDDTMETHKALEIHGPFALWLGDSLIEARIREDRHPTQLEANEAEARKNLPEFECDDEDLENIADDEEDQFRLRGQIIPLKTSWTGKDPANLTSWDRAVRRALRNDDLFAIDRDLRGAVYQYFQASLLERMTSQFAKLLAENARYPFFAHSHHINLCKQRKVLKFLGNTQLVEELDIDIVGCTTTGLSKYRGCLAAMQPQSLLIEEAAETREANIVSALYPSVQQLILVGDHRQLAPQCDIRRLGDAPYNLNVSLFQRMVNLGARYVMLRHQRRMKPELRQLLNPFYPELVDHPSVHSIDSHPDVPGMGGRNSWFFHHTYPEAMGSDYSKLNEFEAEMVTRFFSYLVQNGTTPEKITVLTFYNGQRKALLRKLKRHRSLMGLNFNVCTVDSYQGEENDIVLLSLVRSPRPDRSFAVGFLEDERRAVVAISRARRGFFIFGNVENVLSAHNVSFELWDKISGGFAKQGRAAWDRGIPLVCQPHGREIWIKNVEDWADNCGGCDRPCEQTRPCGHRCTLKCHAVGHEHLQCAEACRERLPCGHGCQNSCGQKCFCDCKAFKEMTREANAAAVQHMSLEEKILQMGAEPSEMLMASLARHQASQQKTRATPMPGGVGALQAVGNGNHGDSRRGQRGNKGGKGGAKRGGQYAYAQVAHTAAQWKSFTENIDNHDEQLRQEHLATAGQGASETVIQDVYQPTALAAGGRRVEVETVDRLVREIPMSHGEASGVRAEGQHKDEETLIPGLVDLALTDEHNVTELLQAQLGSSSLGAVAAAPAELPAQSQGAPLSLAGTQGEQQQQPGNGNEVTEDEWLIEL